MYDALGFPYVLNMQTLLYCSFRSVTGALFYYTASRHCESSWEVSARTATDEQERQESVLSLIALQPALHRWFCEIQCWIGHIARVSQVERFGPSVASSSDAKFTLGPSALSPKRQGAPTHIHSHLTSQIRAAAYCSPPPSTPLFLINYQHVVDIDALRSVGRRYLAINGRTRRGGANTFRASKCSHEVSALIAPSLANNAHASNAPACGVNEILRLAPATSLTSSSSHLPRTPLTPTTTPTPTTAVPPLPSPKYVDLPGPLRPVTNPFCLGA